MLLAKFEQHPLRPKFPPFAGFREIESRSYYGTGYQDVQYRRPSIENAKKYLAWSPEIEMEQSVEQTLDFFLREAVSEGISENTYDSDILSSEREQTGVNPAVQKSIPIISVSNFVDRESRPLSLSGE